jgi:hypothetical protein
MGKKAKRKTKRKASKVASLNRRAEIIETFLGADLIGFQAQREADKPDGGEAAIAKVDG